MYDYTDAEWNAAKDEIKTLLTARAARNEPPISYSELANNVRSISFSPEQYAYHHMLGEVSEEEDAAGRGMLSALVVHRDNQMPGSGFFKLAKKLGRDTSDQDRCWGEEITLVYERSQVERPNAD